MGRVTSIRNRFHTLTVIVFLMISFSSCSIQTADISKRGGGYDISESVSEGIVRFYPAGLTQTDFPPSFAFEEQPVAEGSMPGSWTVFPIFTKNDNQYRVNLNIAEGTSLYGTGEIAGPLLRNGKVSETWNTDAYAYGRENERLYQSHPWVLVVRKDGSSYGVFADTTYRCRIDLTKGIEFSVKERPFPVYIFAGDSPQQVLKRLAGLIGTIELPPKWALGYHQCRWSYYPDARAREIADEFRNRKIPCDVIWFDIHYMDGYRIFTFSPEHYPDPKATNDYMHKHDFKTVWMIDPGVKKEEGYFVYDQGTAGNHWVLTADEEEFNGKVWPGMCAFPDFTRPETRKWWAGLYKDFMATGIDGVWNDMNEPAIFWEEGYGGGTMPDDNIHRGGGNIPHGTHAQYHNIYGMLMVKASREGILAANPDKRPFVLTRANYIGGQKYGATWTGDNVSNWEHLKDSIPMILNLGLSGQPFSGPDIGGFVNDSTPELFARWFGIGAFFPFSRGHTAKDNRDKEPWSFGPEVEEIVQTALERRYRLLPHIYTLFHEASTTGLPVMRPVFFADPADPELRDEDDAFLLGSDLLVLPQTSAHSKTDHQIPGGIWLPISLVENEKLSGDHPELLIRGGAIIPTGKIIQNTTENSLDPLTLIVCLDNNGYAEGILYEDAGEGFGYRNGEYSLTTYEAKTEGDKVIVRIKNREGKWSPDDRVIRVELVTASVIKNALGSEQSKVIVDLSK